MRSTGNGPYPGLDYFAEQDADVFFGREEERKVIIGNLRASRLTLLYAQSGVGKSSLLRAGVAARLRELATRSQRERGSPRFVPVVMSNWRDEPLPSLVTALDDAVQPFVNGRPYPRGLAGDDLRTSIGAAADALDATPLVILDQFEEFFLYHHDTRSGARFADELARCVGGADVRAHFLISIREDAYSQIGEYFSSRIPNVYANYLHLDYLDEYAARQAIISPLARVNEVEGTGYEIEDELVDAILDQVRRPDPRTDDAEVDLDPPIARYETAYLQLVMEKLWRSEAESGSQRLRLATLEGLGGAKKIIQSHVDDAVEGLNGGDRDAAAAALRYLVTSAGSKIALTVDELAEFSGVSGAALEPALAHLEHQRILRSVAAPEPRGGEPVGRRFELFHDVLGPAVREWRKRYESQREQDELSRAFQEDKRRHLAEEEARHAAARAKIVRQALIGLSCLVLLLIGAVVWALLERGVAQDERAVAQEEREQARSRALAATAIGNLSRDPELSVLLAREAWETSPTEQAGAALRTAVGLSHVRGRVDTGPTQWALLADDAGFAATLGEGVVSLWRQGEPDPLNRHTFEAEDAYLQAIAADGSAAAFDVKVGEAWETDVLHARPDAEPVRLDGVAGTYLRLSPDGRLAASIDEYYAPSVWDTQTGEQVASADVTHAGALEFDPADQDRLIGASCESDRIWTWNRNERRTSEITTGGPAPSGAVDSIASCLLAISPDGRYAVESLWTGSARLWDIERKRLVKAKLGAGDAVRHIAWSPDGSRFALATNKTAEIFEARRGELLSRPPGHSDWVNSVAFSPDSSMIATASSDGTARVWDAESGALVDDLRGHGNTVVDAEFGDYGKQLWTVATDGTMRVWATAEGAVLNGGDGWVLDAAMCPDGMLVGTASVTGVARIWNLSSRTSVRVRGGSFKRLNSVAFDRDCGRVLVAGADKQGRGRMVIADAATGAAEDSVSYDSEMIGVEFSPDETKALAVDARGSAVVWPLDSVSVDTLPLPPGSSIRTAQYVAGGDAIVIAGEGGARIVDAETAESEGIEYNRSGSLVGAGVSPNGDRVVSYGTDSTAQIWDAGTGDELAVLRGHASWVADAAFSPDGKRVVTSGVDQTTRIWDAENGSLLSVLRMHGEFVNSVGFAPDGETILSASDDGTARVYRCETCMPTESVYKLSGSRVFRDFTREERQDLVDGEG